jgi:capsular exopolysaccharide synthesis family protein
MASAATADVLRPPAAPAGADRDFDVRYYLDLLWRNRYVLAVAAIVGLSLGMLVAFVQTPEYQAGAMLQIEPPPPAFLSVQEALMVGGGYWQNADFYNTQFKVLRSASLGEKVLERLKLRDRPPFKDNLEAGTQFMAHVGVAPIPESRLVVVQVTHTDPKEAALWANTLAEVYIQQSLANRVDAARQVIEWLQERLDATQQNMRLAQERLLKSYENQDLFVPDGSVSAVTTSITKLNEDYIQAQSRRIAVEAALKQVEELRRAGKSLETVPQVATDGVVLGLTSQIASLNGELTRLKERFKPAHPEIQRILVQISETTKSKDARVGQIVGGLRSELAQIQRRETELKAASDQQKSQAASQSRKATELEALKKEADSRKSLYDVLLQKLNESDIAASLRTNNVSLVEKAVPPQYPVRPQKRRIAGIGLLAGLLLGVGLVLGRDYLDNTIKDPEEIERFLHLDLVAVVPRFGPADSHAVEEAYQSIRTALIFARGNDAGHIVLIAGSAPQEGKTTTLVNIGRVLAASGERVLLVDFDLRRARVHKNLGLPQQPGLSDTLARRAPLEIRPTSEPNLFALTSGALPPSPPALLARKSLADFLGSLRQQFDWVLLDSPPLASVTDALLLARHADLALVVVRYNSVDKKVVRRSVRSLKRVCPNVLGAVFNDLDVKTRGYQYYYGYGYKSGGNKSGDDPSAPGA